jgi:heat-inducible transcriptional repressor
MIKLTERQTQIIKAIVEEYINTGEPVGSDTVEKKYNLGVSPATIRNEMVDLLKKGLLKQPYSSSGRIPTTQALKFYIQRLMEEKELGVAEEMAVKERIWDYRKQLDELFGQATKALAEKTDSLALTLLSNGRMYHSGYANILDKPEFFDIDVTKTVLSMIEDFERLYNMFSSASTEEIIDTLVGTDFGIAPLEPCGSVFTSFKIDDKEEGYLGVIGTCRLDYPYVVPTVRYFGKLLEEILG